MMNRAELLEKLLRLDGSLSEIEKELQTFGWDSDDPLVTLRREDILSILNRYIQSVLTETDIENWANVIEGRDDIGFEQGQDKLIHDIVFELANPSLTQPLNVETAQILIDKLAQ